MEKEQTIQTLKNKLLETNCFVDNEYLDFYCELIESNRETKKEKYKTQSHHIVPQCYYISKNLKIDDSKENLVNLLYKNHVLAHYYLCLCCISHNLSEKLSAAFILMSFKQTFLDNFNIGKLDHYQALYEKYIHYISEYNSEAFKGVNTWSKGSKRTPEQRKRQSEALKGKPQTPEHIKKASLGRTGLKRTPEQRKHQSEAAKNKKFNADNEKKRVDSVKKALNIKIICVETKETFNSISEAEIKYGSKPNGSICNAIKNKCKAYGYHWCKEEDYDMFIPTINKKNKVIQCIETGEIFENIKEAQKAIRKGDINAALAKGYKAGGYHWKYYDEIKCF